MGVRQGSIRRGGKRKRAISSRKPGMVLNEGAEWDRVLPRGGRPTGIESKTSLIGLGRRRNRVRSAEKKSGCCKRGSGGGRSKLRGMLVQETAINYTRWRGEVLQSKGRTL